MEEAAMDGGAAVASVAPPQHQHTVQDAGHVGKPPVLETCDETDRLLAADDSSQELVPEMEDVTMEDTAASAEKPAALNGDNKAAEEVSGAVASAEKPTDAESATTVQEVEPTKMQEAEDAATTTNDVEMAAEKKIEEKAEEHKEHPALEHERAWYGELPAFVKKAYGLAEEVGDVPTEEEFVSCSHCSAIGQSRALASVCCMEESCGYRDKAMCSACFPAMHATAQARSHRQRLFKACPQCHLKRATDWCVGCDLSFCSECFAAIHDGVKRSVNHKKFSLDGTTGDMLLRANWTPHFRSVIIQLQLEQRQQLAAEPQLAPFVVTPSNGSAASTPTAQSQQAQAGGYASTLKRKRPDEPPEIITIDEDSTDSDMATRYQQLQAASRIVGARTTLAASRPTGLTAPTAQFRSLPPSNSMDLNGTSRGTTPKQTHAFNSASSAMSTPVAAPTLNNLTYSHNANAWQIPAVNNSFAAPQATASPTTVAVPSAAGRIPQQENPIESVMFERMNQLSQQITLTEDEVAMINGQIVQASYRSVVNAHGMMAQLDNAQQRLRQLTTKRDVTVVHLVAQSKPIISKVKLLRIDLLGDIPQVHAAGYRRIFQLSNQIAEAEVTLADMDRRMETTLEHISVMSSEVFHRAVTHLSTSMQAQRQTIENFKEERENEVVRLVQYHNGIRETLKRAVQQNQMRRQQQSQYIQPTHAPTPSQAVTMQPTSYPMMAQQMQQSQGLYQQFQQHQQQQLVQTPMHPLGYNYNEVSQQRTSDASADPPISPPPFP